MRIISWNAAGIKARVKDIEGQRISAVGGRRDCTKSKPDGEVCALIGPAGRIVCGGAPAGRGAAQVSGPDTFRTPVSDT